jgi:hypothetical protein
LLIRNLAAGAEGYDFESSDAAKRPEKRRLEFMPSLCRIQCLGAHPSFSRVAGAQAKTNLWLLVGIMGLLMMMLSVRSLAAHRERLAASA